MVTATNSGAIPEMSYMEAPESIKEAVQSTPLVLPEGRHTINIKMAKKHPAADVINAIGKCMIAIVSGTLIYLFGKREIVNGSSFAAIETALNIFRSMDKQGS